MSRRDVDAAIKTPACPVCSGPPSFNWAEITPWFCINDDCDVLAWDPYSSLEENLMNAGTAEIHEIKRESPENE